MKNQTLLLSGVAFSALFAAAAPALSADLGAATAPPPALIRMPAVDGLNGKVELFGGWTDLHSTLTRRNHFSGGGMGSLSIPLGGSFGAQFDVLAASHGGRGVVAGASHLFWRDPSRGLLGLYGTGAHHDRWGGVTQYRFGAEASAYFDRWSVNAVLGAEWGTRGSIASAVALPGFIVTETVGKKARFFDMVDVNFYVTDNFKLSAGHRYVGGRHAAALGMEALLHSANGLAITGFVDGRIGQKGYRAVWGGVKVYFGQKDKTLIRRHREDDPPNWLRDEMFSPGNRARRLTTPTGTPPGGGGGCTCGPCYGA